MVLRSVAYFSKLICDYKDVGNFAWACNWETSAVLKTAQLNGIKSFSFRVITDNAGEEMKDNLNANWKKALEIMFTALNKFIYFDIRAYYQGGIINGISRKASI